MPAPGNERGQLLLAEEFFSGEHDAFVETLRTVNQPKALAAFVDRWKKDPRPWARKQILAYLAQPLSCPGHQPVVKRLFKQAEETNDHEIMVAFLVAFDRQVRREIQTKRKWNFAERTVEEAERLVTPRDVIALKFERTSRNPATGATMSYTVRDPQRSRRPARLFTYRTRYYLRRRAWRYFRRLGHRDPAVYLPAIVNALAAYEDADLQRGENILDSWALLHACFGTHDALEFGATHVRLKDGRTLGELTPAPQFPDAWKKPEAAPMVLALAVHARARLVRVWALQLFQRDHASFTVPLETILALLEHDEPDLQQFGAKLLESMPGLATLPLSSWLKLLQTKNDDALQRICDAFARNVTGDRLDLAQCVELACVRPVAVARLGQRYLRDRVISSAADREQIAGLAGAKCRAVAGELTTWALGILGTKENYSLDQVIRFFDSPLAEIRAPAWTWFKQSDPGITVVQLLAYLIETPWDDLKSKLIDHLKEQTKLPCDDAHKLDHLWRSVLLGVHRGGRQKAKAVHQVAQAIVADPARGDTLLPVLAVAVRSVRGPEARAGLAAVASVVEAQPQLADAVRRYLPEMNLQPG